MESARMFPYELIVTSASRPHLLGPTLESLLTKVSHLPERILIHDDAAFEPGTLEAEHRWLEIKAIVLALSRHLDCQIVLHHADPPRKLGLALTWLIRNVRTTYILYSQDDFVTVRKLPLEETLQIMDLHGLHQVRFNKRATMGQKDTWQGVWKKEERTFLHGGGSKVLTIADHWYFQTGLWRVIPIRQTLDWLTATPLRTQIFASGSPEVAINKVMDGFLGPIPGLNIPYPEDALEAGVRAQIQKTFIYGPIGEDRYIRHIGSRPVDWSGEHGRGADELKDSEGKNLQAWAEIREYRKEG